MTKPSSRFEDKNSLQPRAREALLPTLHIFSDVATPHNNSLIAALRASGEIRIVTWYAHRSSAQLPWKEELGGDGDNHYFDNWPNRWRALRAVLNRRDQFLFVGYSNPINKAGVIWRVLASQRFMMWFDHPEDRTGFAGALRRLAYKLVQRADPLFVVGTHTKEWFEQRGFAPPRVVNLPIFIDVPNELPDAATKTQVRRRYRVPEGHVLVVAASRLAFAKGYDLLLRAFERLDSDVRAAGQLLIVGTGPEKQRLEGQIEASGLVACVRIVDWLAPADYAALLAAADLFVHPARFDAFGGGTLYAMAHGVPVVGSLGAGAVRERIQHGINGLTYLPDDVDGLASLVSDLIRDARKRARLGLVARETAEHWTPQRGAEILIRWVLKRPTRHE